MSTILLLGVIAFFAIMTYIGYTRGLVKTIFSLFSVIIVFILVSTFTPMTRTLIKHTPIYTSVEKQVSAFVEDNITAFAEKTSIATLGVEEQKKSIDGLPIPKSIKEELIENNTEEGYKQLEVTTFNEYLSAAITDLVINAIAFIVLFIIVVIAIKVVVSVLDIVAKLPVLNFFNNTGGAILGFVQALIIVWIACIVITAFSTTSWGQSLFKAINDNFFLSFIYNNNFLKDIAISFFK